MRSLHGGFHKILDETDMSQFIHYSIVYHIVPQVMSAFPLLHPTLYLNVDGIL
jgi:hypothetical protein